VIAHPERNAEVQEDPEELRSLVDAGALVQVTAASLDGRAGRSSQATAFELIRRGLVHVLASDAHDASVREGGLGPAVETLGDPAVARYLTRDVPLAIITDAPLPRRPKARRRRLFRR
jgi:protein-tyrosine phosphatase